MTTFEVAVFAFQGNQGQKERAHLERFLSPLDQRLASQEYLVDESFTAADVVRAYDSGILSGAYYLKAHPSVQKYLSRLLARPAGTSFAKAIGWQQKTKWVHSSMMNKLLEIF